MPDSLKTNELCLIAVKSKSGGYALEYVPENLKSAELFLEAVKQNRYALEDAPRKLHDKIRDELGL